MVHLCVVGSGTGVPSPRRASPSYLATVGLKRLLVDSGFGTFRRLAQLGVSIHDLDYLLYTHFHPDHISDIVHFFFAAKNPSDPRTKPVTVFGPKGLRIFFDRLLEAYHGVFKPQFDCSFVELEASECEPGPFRLITLPLHHTPYSIGYRIEAEGKSLVFSGDTDVCDNIVVLSKACDLLVLECSFPDDEKVPGHLTPTECGEIAKRAGVRRLLLSHFYPPCEGKDLLGSCRRHFQGEIVLAEDSMRLEVL